MTNRNDTDDDSQSDNELTQEWNERISKEGYVYYANHVSKRTQWSHPGNQKRYYVDNELPYGWEVKMINENGDFEFVNVDRNIVTRLDPRLAYQKQLQCGNSPLQLPEMQMHDSSSSGASVLKCINLSGKYAIVTGGSSGIGLSTVQNLAEHGAHVVMMARNLKKATEAVLALRKQTKLHLHIEVMFCDLLSLSSVMKFIRDYTEKGLPLHILILNAAIFSAPYLITEDGFESTFQVNFLSQALLAFKFTTLMSSTGCGRIVFVSSESHRFASYLVDPLCIEQFSFGKSFYIPMMAYNTSKYCMVLMSFAMNTRLRGKGVTVNCVHPGNMVYSDLSRNWWLWKALFFVLRPFTKTLSQAAATTLYVATHQDLEGLGGYYFVNCWQTQSSSHSQLSYNQDKLYDFTDMLLKKAIKKLSMKSIT